MNITREHLSGLELALDELNGIASGEAYEVIYRLAEQAKAAPVAEAVAFFWKDIVGDRKCGPFFGAPSDHATALVADKATPIMLYTAPPHDAELVELLRATYELCTEREMPSETALSSLAERIDTYLATPPRT